MKKGIPFLMILFVLFSARRLSLAQSDAHVSSDSLEMNGQASAWGFYHPSSDLSFTAGARYIPEIQYSIQLPKRQKLQWDAAINLSGFADLRPFDSLVADGNFSLYRAQFTYTKPEFELRFGLQKISFGSAVLLRPLMWFDQIDPRDPLQLTNGVWGGLARYYFTNNANIWLWALYGNEKERPWDVGLTKSKIPEVGTRIQLPISRGEMALSYHFRSTSLPDSLGPGLSEIPENRLGFDARWDVDAGLWIEGSWVHKGKNAGGFSNQLMLNLGADYTFGLGNGLYTVFEHLTAQSSEKLTVGGAFAQFSALSTQYPLGIVDQLSTMFFYDWTNRSVYSFVNWNHRFKQLTFYLMAYWNPQQYLLPQKDNGGQNFAGKGFQLMLVYNH